MAADVGVGCLTPGPPSAITIRPKSGMMPGRRSRNSLQIQVLIIELGPGPLASSAAALRVHSKAQMRGPEQAVFKRLLSGWCRYLVRWRGACCGNLGNLTARLKRMRAGKKGKPNRRSSLWTCCVPQHLRWRLRKPKQFALVSWHLGILASWQLKLSAVQCCRAQVCGSVLPWAQCRAASPRYCSVSRFALRQAAEVRWGVAITLDMWHQSQTEMMQMFAGVRCRRCCEVLAQHALERGLERGRCMCFLRSGASS